MRKIIFKKISPWLIGCCLFFLWLHFVDFQGILASVSNLRKGAVLIFLALSLPCFFFAYHALRWRLVLWAVGFKLPFMQAFFYNTLSYFTNFLIPIHMGEPVKILLLRERENIPVHSSTAASLVDKSLDLLPCLLIFPFLFSLQFPDLVVKGQKVIIVSFLILFILFSFWFFFFLCAKKGGTLVSIIENIPLSIWRGRILEFTGRFIESLEKAFSHSRLVFLAVLVEVSLFLSGAMVSWFFFYIILGQKVAFASILPGYGLVYLSGFIPHPPAQLGSIELISLFIYHNLLGIDAGAVNTLLLLSRVANTAVFVPIGIISATAVGLDRNRLSEYMNRFKDKFLQPSTTS